MKPTKLMMTAMLASVAAVPVALAQISVGNGITAGTAGTGINNDARLDLEVPAGASLNVNTGVRADSGRTQGRTTIEAQHGQSGTFSSIRNSENVRAGVSGNGTGTVGASTGVSAGVKSGVGVR